MEVRASTEPAIAVVTITSLILEPSWFSQVYEGQSDSSDRDMAKLVGLAEGNNAIYSVWLVHGLELVYR